MSDITERLRAALAALKGWSFDRCEPADEGEAAEIGGSHEDGDFAPLVTVDAALYYQPEHSMPIARALSTLATSAQETLSTIESLRAEVERLKRRPLTEEQLDAMRQADNGALNFVTLRAFRVVARAIERAQGITGD